MKKKSVLALSLWASAFAGGYLAYDYAIDQRFAYAEEKREEVRKGLNHAEDLATAFRQVGKVVEPSVVSIEVRKRATMPVQGNRRQAPPQLDEDMLRRFFPDRDRDGEPDLPRGFEEFDFGDPDSAPRGRRHRQRRHHGILRRQGLYRHEQPRRRRRRGNDDHPPRRS